jgi:hypothetical protein
MKLVIDDAEERKTRIYNRPLSAIQIDGKKINYYDYISSMKNGDLNNSIIKIVPKVDERKINELVNSIPCISELQKSFYKLMLSERKHVILDEIYNKLIKSI